MRCVITGVAGFIGSHLADRLLAEGHEVCGIDVFTNYYPRTIKEKNLEVARSYQRFTLIEGDVLTVSLPPLLEGVDWIFHQAGQAGVRTSWGQEFKRYVDYNIIATQQLLDAALQVKGVRRFIYASSSSVYGDTSILPIAETVTPHPVSPYGVTKLAAEHLCTLYHRNFGLPTVSLRYFTVYGPRQRPDMAFHRFCQAVLEHQPISVYDNGEQKRDFTYIDDIIEANIHAAISPPAPGQVLNVAGGSYVTINQAIQLLKDVSGIPIHVEYASKQKGDIHDIFADISLAKKVLDYYPRVSLKEGLEQEFEDIRSSLRSRSRPFAVSVK